jgi:hypothetical protein
MVTLALNDFLWAGPNLGGVSIDLKRCEEELQQILTPLMSLGVIK